MLGLSMIAKSRSKITRAISEAENMQPHACGSQRIETSFCDDIRNDMVKRANALVAEVGLKRALKKMEGALRLRSTHLVFDPTSYASPRLKLWDKGIAFRGFKEVVRDETGLWGITFSCDYTWSHGFGNQKTTQTETVERTLRFDYDIAPETIVDALFE